MDVTINAGWLVFGALVAVWAALIADHRIRNLSNALEATSQELAQVRSKLEALQASLPKPVNVGGLGQLGAAVESKRQSAPEGVVENRLSPPC